MSSSEDLYSCGNNDSNEEGVGYSLPKIDPEKLKIVEDDSSEDEKWIIV